MLSQNSFLTGQLSAPCWFMGAMTGGADQTNRFIDEGIWEHDFDDSGNTVSVMAIKATGVIAENMGDGRRLRVHWQRVSPPREWYFYTYQPTIWKVTPGDRKADALIDFSSSIANAMF
jgi:5-methylcytosine-specific restriction protein B